MDYTKHNKKFELPQYKEKYALKQHQKVRIEDLLQIFVDDLELYADQANGMLQARSVSRLGDSDLGVNSRRLTALQEAL